MSREDEEYSFKENVEMMNLNHIFQEKQTPIDKTIGFNTDSLYIHMEEQNQKEHLE